MKQFRLNSALDLSQVNNSTKVDNAAAFVMLKDLTAKGYYIIVHPTTSDSGEPMFDILAVKKGEDRVHFSLMANEDIANYIVALLLGVDYDDSTINANDLDSFKNNIINFELDMYKAEKERGKVMKKDYSNYGLKIQSKYLSRGVIVYEPYNNPELKAYINA